MSRFFLAKHAKALAKKYAGRYIAVANDKVVAVGKSRLETYKKAVRKLSSRRGLGIYYFPKPKELLSALWTFLI